jgi:hypothetical protein
MDGSDYEYSGGGGLDEFATKLLGQHHTAALVVIIVLLILLVWCMYFRKEGFNPTQTMSFTDSDQYALGKQPTRSDSVFSQSGMDSTGGSITYDPKAAPGAVGSMSYQILQSPNFACATRKAVGDDAWAWMYGQATSQENLVSGKPHNDNDFSQILSGH